MKQLINKANPNIRIIAEEIKDLIGGYAITIEKCNKFYSVQDWTLSDYEEPKSDKVEPIIEDDKTVGVKIPVINKAIYFADIKDNVSWEDAVKYAESLGKKIPTHRELCILAYFRKEIEEICPKFKDVEYIWGEQYSAYDAWYLDCIGYLYYSYKYNDFTVVPLADLSEQPQLTELEEKVKDIIFCSIQNSQNIDENTWAKKWAKDLLELAKKELEK